MEGSDGVLYGTTGERSGPVGYEAGAVYRLHKDGSGYSILHRFAGSLADGFGPTGGLVEGSDGTFYGTTIRAGAGYDGIVFNLNKDGGGYRALRGFSRSGGDGSNPSSGSGLVEGDDGLLYGTTPFGGTNYWGGTVFKVSKNGNGYTLLRSFSNDGEGGRIPVGLIEGKDGLLYGTTERGGSADAGTVFKLNTEGSAYTVTHSFTGGGGGSGPVGRLMEGVDGLLYGTTISGGGNDSGGTVFKLNKNGSGYAVLLKFTSFKEEWSPVGVLEGSDGSLYGTTSSGGITNTTVASGFGSIFKLNKSGGDYVVLHRFDGSAADGMRPNELVEARDGSLYGTTDAGGTPNASGSGTVFKLSKDGSGYTILHKFTGSGGDGSGPVGSLTEGHEGKLYGTTRGGGANGMGTVFMLNGNGSGYTVLRSFADSGGDGNRPFAGLVEASDGALYGTAFSGGDLGLGTLFKLFASTPIVAATRLERSGENVLLTFSGGAATQSYPIQATTNLSPANWQIIGSQTAGIDGRFSFLDTSSSHRGTRFYRSVTQ
jgi:uncharacterized repeat protein (TIGR03803 family)